MSNQASTGAGSERVAGVSPSGRFVAIDRLLQPNLDLRGDKRGFNPLAPLNKKPGWDRLEQRVRNSAAKFVGRSVPDRDLPTRNDLWRIGEAEGLVVRDSGRAPCAGRRIEQVCDASVSHGQDRHWEHDAVLAQ